MKSIVLKGILFLIEREHVPNWEGGIFDKNWIGWRETLATVNPTMALALFIEANFVFFSSFFSL